MNIWEVSWHIFWESCNCTQMQQLWLRKQHENEIFRSEKTDLSALPHVRKAVLGIPLITNTGLCSTWLTSRCQSRHQRQRGTQSWLFISRQRRTQSVNPTLWIDWWEASFGNAGTFGEKNWAWVYGLLNVCNTYWTDGAVGLTVGHLVLVENFNSHKIGKNCCSNSQCLSYGCIHILITSIHIANVMFSSLTGRTSLCTHVL